MYMCYTGSHVEVFYSDCFVQYSIFLFTR
uniref:Uncharacterized protein n=1 Tax=Arundo donax TaxID=35708 RepID=A0A0A9FP89_ARUDO